MHMGDELAQSTATLMSRSSEVTAKAAITVMQMLLEIIKKAKKESKDKDNKLFKGKVSTKDFLQLAENGGYKQQNIHKKDVNRLIEEAKKANIPINIRQVSEDYCSVCYLTRDADMFEQCTRNVLHDKLELNKNDYVAFKVEPFEVDGLKKELEANGISADFAQTNNGEVKCVYEAKDKPVMDKIKADFREKQMAVAEKLEVTYNDVNKSFIVKDTESGKAMKLSSLPTEAKLVSCFQERMGMDEAKAVMCCQKFEASLSQEQQKFFKTDTYQIEKVANLERNVRFTNDSPLVSDFSFSRIKMRADNHNHFAVSNGDHVVRLCPDIMSRKDMEEAVKSKLGIIDKSVIAAVVDKAFYANKRFKENDKAVDKDISKANVDGMGEGKTVDIERTTENRFTVTLDGKEKTYSFADAKEQLMADGYSKAKAAEIIGKAKKQSAAGNMFKRFEKDGIINNKSVKEHINNAPKMPKKR